MVQLHDVPTNSPGKRYAGTTFVVVLNITSESVFQIESILLIKTSGMSSSCSVHRSRVLERRAEYHDHSLENELAFPAWVGANTDRSLEVFDG
jgi:hypothetical protein